VSVRFLWVFDDPERPPADAVREAGEVALPAMPDRVVTRDLRVAARIGTAVHVVQGPVRGEPAQSLGVLDDATPANGMANWGGVLMVQRGDALRSWRLPDLEPREIDTRLGENVWQLVDGEPPAAQWRDDSPVRPSTWFSAINGPDGFIYGETTSREHSRLGEPIFVSHPYLIGRNGVVLVSNGTRAAASATWEEAGLGVLVDFAARSIWAGTSGEYLLTFRQADGSHALVRISADRHSEASCDG